MNLTRTCCDVLDENTKEYSRKEQTHLIYYLEFVLAVLCPKTVK